MQWPLLTLCCCLLASPVVLGSPIGQEVDERTVQQQHHQLLGAKECTWGPSYWCYNITNAKGCNAVKHCIQTVWEKHAVPEDHDSICDICLDMVQQARDQLRSNMTQEDLKAVFEGSCKLIPIKVVAKECIKLADDFIPELVEALSSQMNPQAVCSVAGLCNNAAIDRMLEAEATQKRLAVVPLASAANEFTCTKCNSIGGIIAQKFHSADRDSVLEAMLRQCGQMSSFSDACSSIVITYFEEIYSNLKNTLNRETICHMSGVCAAQFHQHDDVAEEAVSVQQLQKSMSPVESVKDDIPCELCKQLVHHLKELLIANTTEIEFKQVLEGLCKQTKSFQSECLSIVDNYYIQIYHTLVTDLNENEACCAIEICPRGLAARAALTAGIAPLLPAVPAAHLDVHITAKPRLTKKQYLGQGEPKLSTSQIASAQLPIDTLMASPNANRLVEGGVLCPVCEFVTNFVATELADETVDESIKTLVKNSCLVISPLLKPMCDMFIDTYGDAVIALFAEVVQPDQICPAMLMCAAAPPKDVEVMSRIDADGITVNGQTGTEKCPMCLLAVAEAQAAVQSDKSVDNIKSVLNRLCVHLPTKMKLECNDFVETYTKELVRMLAKDFSAEAICVQLQLCDPKKSSKPLNLVPIASEFGGDIETNEISDSTFNGIEVGSIVIDNRLSPNCLLCEEVVKEVEKHISNKKSRDQIKKSLERVCSRLHKIQAKCTALVQKYGDKLVDLIMGEFTPKQICRTLGQCIVMMEVEMVPTNKQQQITSAADDFFVPNIEHELFDGNTAYIHANGPNPTICVICQTIMTKLEDELKDASTQKQIEDTVKKICHKLPKSYDTPCTNFVDSYGAMVITLLDTTPPKEICGHLSLCSPPPITETKLDVLECAVCHAATQQMIRVLEDPKTERSIEHVVEKVCPWLPGKYNASCVKLIEIYGHSMMTIISRGELQTVCTQIGMCFADEYASFAQVVSTDDQ